MSLRCKCVLHGQVWLQACLGKTCGKCLFATHSLNCFSSFINKLACILLYAPTFLFVAASANHISTIACFLTFFESMALK